MTPCPQCHIDLDGVAGNVVLDQGHPQLHCPMCGAEIALSTALGFTFDQQQGALVVWGQPFCEIPHGGLTVQIHGQEKHVEDCLYDHVAFFEAFDRSRVCPVRPEAQHLIADWRLATGGGTHAVIYEVIAKGGARKSVSVACTTIPNPPQGSKQNEAALLVWPNFKMRAPSDGRTWKRYYVTFITPSVPDGTGELHRIGGSANEVCQLGGHWAELDFVPYWIELKWEDNRDKQTYFAVVKPELRDVVPTNAERVTFGIDFGTSNTAAAIRIAWGGSQRADEAILRIADLTLPVIAGEITKETYWLPRPAAPASSLPTYLYFSRALQPHEIHDRLRPVEDYVIPFAQIDLVDDYSIGGFKWKKLVEKRALKDQVGALRFLYLRLALEMYLAQAISDYSLGPGPIELVATFPLAFDNEHQNLHHTSFQKVCELLETCCPFRFSLATDLNESHAGENGSDPLTDIEELLIVDCGGGTTDICVTEPFPSEPDGDTEPGGRRAVYQQDSFEYGGESAVGAIQPLTRGPMSLFNLRQTIRERQASALQDPALYADRRAHEGAQRIGWSFRAGLVEICARFIAARMESLYSGPKTAPRFGLLMLGNGWKLLEPAAAQRNVTLSTYVKEQVDKRLQDYQKAGMISKLPAEIKPVYSAHAKGAVALGAAKKDLITVWPGQQEQTYMLLDMEMAIGNSPRKLGWRETVPATLDSRPRSLRLDGTQQFGFDDTQIRDASGQAVSAVDFLAHCAPDVDKTKQIRKSPFGVYLSLYAESFKP